MSLSKSGVSRNSWSAIILSSLFLVSLGMIVHNAFADTIPPSNCPNRYDGTFTSFMINNGSQTFDAIANHGAAFNENITSSYNITFAIHTANASTLGNTNTGTIYVDSFGAPPYPYGYCINNVGPDQNVTISANVSYSTSWNTYKQPVDFELATDSTNNGTNFHFSAVTYIVNWISIPPQNLQATSGNSKIFLSWTKPSYDPYVITNYNIYRSTSSGTETFLTRIGDFTSYNDTAVTDGQTYFYRVSVIDSAGDSPQSNEASATPVGPPQPPTGLSATSKILQIDLVWNAPTDNGGSAITGYDIERSTDGGSTWNTLAPNTASTGTTYSDTHVLPLTDYTYRVFAINGIGTSDPSNTASATTSSLGTITMPSLP